MENGNGETSNNNNDNARLAIMELANMISVPMSLNAIIKLKIAYAIWEGGSNAPLSPNQILTKIRLQGGGDAENLFIMPKASTGLRKNTGSSVELPVSLTVRVFISIIFIYDS
uniref:Uncharacterized protein n=1 Tax=Solanum lycopersicum TaxID=4081 RepID=K4D418_SOLLC